MSLAARTAARGNQSRCTIAGAPLAARLHHHSLKKRLVPLRVPGRIQAITLRPRVTVALWPMLAATDCVLIVSTKIQSLLTLVGVIVIAI